MIKPIRHNGSVKLFDKTIGEYVVVERRIQETESCKTWFGYFSFKGERLGIWQQGGHSQGSGEWEPPTGEDYPPPRRRCRTKAAQQWHDEQLALP